MKTDTVIRARTNTATLAVAALAVVALAGCNSNPPPGSQAYKSGALGNGDFLFSCAGSACLRYSSASAEFPGLIATGSTFAVRFVAKDQQGSSIVVHNRRYEGITSEGVDPYIGSGTEGLAALKPGYGTVIARDSAGTIIDFVTLSIVKPDALVVYDADTDDDTTTPSRIESPSLRVGDRVRYRVGSEIDGTKSSGGQTVAGTIPVEWSADSPEAVSVESMTGGIVTLRANAEGPALLTVKGAGLTKKIIVAVHQ